MMTLTWNLLLHVKIWRLDNWITLGPLEANGYKRTAENLNAVDSLCNVLDSNAK